MENLITFKLIAPSVVVILRDASLASSISWLASSGYEPIIEQFIARREKNSVVDDVYFCGFAKYFDADATVTLDGNNSFDWANSMYAVCILPLSANGKILDLLCQITVDNDSGKNDPYVWIEGGKGVSLVNPVDDKVKFGMTNKDTWSELINLEEFGSAQLLPFDIKDFSSGILYQLAYKVSSAPGLFRSTNVITIVPRFCIVNCTREIIRLRQKNNEESPVIALEPQTSKIWHPLTSNKTSDITDLVIRTQSSPWSLASIDMNEIGTSVVILPKIKSFNVKQTVLSVDVRLSANDDEVIKLSHIHFSYIFQS